MAVGEMVEKGMRDVFDKDSGRDVSEVTIKQTGERLPLVKRNGIYVLELELDEPEECWTVHSRAASQRSAGENARHGAVGAMSSSGPQSAAEQWCSNMWRPRSWCRTRRTAGAEERRGVNRVAGPLLEGP